MNEYKKLYHMMFNKVTDVIVELEKLQLDVEEEYLNLTEDVAEETPKLRLVKRINEKTPSF